MAKFRAFAGKRYLLDPGVRVAHEGFELLGRIYSQELNLTDFHRGIYGGSNSGFGAIMLACLLGYRRIYLLGYDMVAVARTHWHTGYSGQRLAEFNKNLERFAAELHEWAPRFSSSGVEIVQLFVSSPDETVLTCFEKRKLSEVVCLENHL